MNDPKLRQQIDTQTEPAPSIEYWHVSMKIGFWGSGNMARVLGGAWSIAGHQITFGSGDAAKSREVANDRMRSWLKDIQI